MKNFSGSPLHCNNQVPNHIRERNHRKSSVLSALPLRLSLRGYGFCMATLFLFCFGSLFYQLNGGPPEILLDIRQYLGKNLTDLRAVTDILRGKTWIPAVIRGQNSRRLMRLLVHSCMGPQRPLPTLLPSHLLPLSSAGCVKASETHVFRNLDQSYALPSGPGVCQVGLVSRVLLCQHGLMSC